MAIPKTEEIKGYPLGMTNLGDPTALPEGTCRNAVNVDFDNAGVPRLRKGRTKVYAGTDVDSLWSSGGLSLFREGGALKGLERDQSGTYTARTYRTGLATSHRLSYLALHGEIYYSNGLITGKIANGSDGPWGVERPARQPALSALSTGGMHAGVYQVAITFRSAAGEESGTGLAASVTVGSGGGIVLSSIPVPVFATTVSVYCSMADGDVLYLYGDYPAGTPNVSLSAFQSDYALETQFGYPPPPGQCLEAFNGRIYIAQNTIVVSTEPLRYGLYMPHRFPFAFGAPVTVIKAVIDGLYIATTAAIHFQGGIDTDAAFRRTVLPYGAPHCPALEIPKTSNIAIFTHRGWAVAGPSGEIKNVMDDRNAVSKFERGAALYREDRGVAQLIGLLEAGEASSYAAQDYIDYEIARRGSAV